MAMPRKVGEKNTGNRGKGRPKGTPNKTTKLAKDAIALAAEGLGGAKRLQAWAREDPANEKVFWSNIYTKLIPVQLEGSGDSGEIIFKTVYQSAQDD